MTDRVEIVEVGPRDGLQNDPSRLTTVQKLELIDRLVNCGVARIEAASFVNPSLVPSMADSGEVMAGVKRDRSVRYIGLALNETGMRRAVEAGCDEINFVLVASPGFGLKNQNATPEQSLERLQAVAPIAQDAGIALAATISVAFGDPFDGEVDPGVLTTLAKGCDGLGVFEIALGDTIGVADPWAVREAIARVREGAPNARLRLHFHNTRNTAIANVFAAYEAGVRVFDASIGGLGGCPFAPGATGNVATEDLAYLFARGGIETGLDLERLIETTHWLAGLLGHATESALARAGGFPSRS
jgi:hydroxymethylglutaryl-CoA lyase